jgi:hypothetical protein
MPNIKVLQNVTIYNSITSVSSIETPEIDGRNNQLIIKGDSSSSNSWTFNNSGTLLLPLTSDIRTNDNSRSIINDPVVNTLTVNNSAYVLSSFVVGDSTPISGAKFSVKGDVVVDGSLVATGSATFVNTVFTTTSALCVVNIGTGPALVVKQEGDQAVAAFYDHENGIGLWVDGDTSRPGYVGIKTSSPNEALTVVGNISASGQIYGNNTINKFVSSFGDGVNVSYTIQHNMSKEDVIVSVIDTSTKEVVYPSVVYTTPNQVTVSFSDAPAASAFKVIIIG